MSVCLYVHICTTPVPGVQGNQKRELDTLELASEMLATLWLLGNEPRNSGSLAGVFNC